MTLAVLAPEPTRAMQLVNCRRKLVAAAGIEEMQGWCYKSLRDATLPRTSLKFLERHPVASLLIPRRSASSHGFMAISRESSVASPSGAQGYGCILNRGERFWVLQREGNSFVELVDQARAESLLELLVVDDRIFVFRQCLGEKCRTGRSYDGCRVRWSGPISTASSIGGGLVYGIRKALCLAVAALLVGCRGSGYIVRIETNEVSSIDPALRARLSSEAKKNGFASVGEGEEISAYPGAIVDSYSKPLSDSPHDDIAIQVFYENMKRPPARVVITVYNEASGVESPTKTDIDALADRFWEELTRWFGVSNVTITRGPTASRIFR